MLSDWAYRVSPVGRLEARARETRGGFRRSPCAPRGPARRSPRSRRAARTAAPAATRRARGDAETTSDAKRTRERRGKASRESPSRSPSSDALGAYMGGGVSSRAIASDPDPGEPSRSGHRRAPTPRETVTPRAPGRGRDASLRGARHAVRDAVLGAPAARRRAGDPERSARRSVANAARMSPASSASRDAKAAAPTEPRRVCGARLESSPRERVYAPARMAHIRSRARARGRAPRDPASAPGGASGGAAPVSDAVDGDGFSPPEGTAVGVWLHAVHRDPAVWDKPDAFAPRRWLVDDGVPTRAALSGAGEEPPRVRHKGSAHAVCRRAPRVCWPTPRLGVHACDAGAARVRVRVCACGGARSDDALGGVHGDPREWRERPGAASR